MIDTLVVPLDGSPLAEAALSPARALAEKTGATVRLVRVARDDDEVEKYLDVIAGDLGFDRVTTSMIDGGPVADSILREAQNPGAIVCMTTHGRSGLGRALLGSVAEAVLLGSERPLLLVGPALEPGAWTSEHWFVGGKAMVTIDGSGASEAVLPAAREWTTLLGLEPWIVQVIDGDSHPEAPAPKDLIETASVRRAAQVMRDGGVEPQWEVLHGDDAARTLLDFAAQLPAALVATATHGQTGMAGVALGRVAMKIVHESSCPVLVVRSPLPAG